jgi:hypothetical protein
MDSGTGSISANRDSLLIFYLGKMLCLVRRPGSAKGVRLKELVEGPL